MSRETIEWLNRMVLVGMTSKRGNAWHYKMSAQGTESNHYPLFIPAGDVQRRLFNFTAETRRVAVELPATFEDMTHLSQDGQPMRWSVQDDRKAIAHSEDGTVFGMFKDGYQPHQFSEWLIGTVSNILTDTLNITSAGLLKAGAVGWVEVSVPENFHTPEGVTFRPNILAGTSCDGSLATFFKRTITSTVCDNTFEIARGESGFTYKVKHTRNSGFKLSDARSALELIDATGDDFSAEVKALCETTVTDKQWAAFLEGFAPTTDKGVKLQGRSLTMAEHKQDTLRRLYRNDTRVSPWAGTAFGVLQATNTYWHHESIVRGTNRVERNLLNAIDGTTAKNDEDTLSILRRVLVTV
jgi:phage/plasmid-like protein (TIGR03299 family)